MYKIYNSVRSDSPWEIYFNEGDELPYAPIGSTAYNVDTGVTMINDGNGWIEKISISTGSGVEINNQDKIITQNGVYSADEGFTGLGNVTVSVASNGDGWDQLDALIDKSITEISSNTTSIGHSVFRDCTNLKTVNFPVATTIGGYAFYRCARLLSANFPVATTIDSHSFDSCSALKAADFRLVTTITDYTFDQCSKLETVNFPAATTIKGYSFRGCKSLITVNFPVVTTIDSEAFGECSKLETADFSVATSIFRSAFKKCVVLSSLILRSTETVCTLSNTTAFTSTPIASGTGYIYVPSALIEDYKAATNWATYATQFRALEDYTVDGTVTGELDETKI